VLCYLFVILPSGERDSTPYPFLTRTLSQKYQKEIFFRFSKFTIFQTVLKLISLDNVVHIQFAYVRKFKILSYFWDSVPGNLAGIYCRFVIHRRKKTYLRLMDKKIIFELMFNQGMPCYLTLNR
jgi:hypothetical protein